MGIIVAFCAMPAFLAFIGALVIFCGGRRRIPTQKILASGLLVMSIGICYTFIFRLPSFERSYMTDWLLTTCSLLSPPIFFLYFCRLTGTGSSTVKSAIFLPAVLVSILNLIFYLMMGSEQAGQYFYQVSTTGSLGEDPSALWIAKRVVGSYIYRAVILITAVFAMIFSLRRVRSYHRDMEDFYANADEKYFKADKMTLYGYVALTVAVMFYSATSYGKFEDHIVYLIFLTLAIGAGVVFLTYYCLKQNYTADDLKKIRSAGSSREGGITRAELLHKLDSIKNSELCYDPEVNLVSMAENLGTDSDTLTDIIAKRYGTSFSNFVNNVRIKKAIELMRNISPNTPLTQISRLCGYDTYASFARNFQQFAHSTPSEWMRRYRQRII